MSGLNQENLRVAKTIKLFIGGEFPRTESGRSFPVYYAKTKKVYAHVCQASRKDLRNAITAAQSALSGWSCKTAYNRGQILYRMAEMLEGKREEIVEVFKSTLGYQTKAAQEAVDGGVDAFVYYAGFADKFQQLSGAVNPVASPHHSFTTPEPVGVVGLISDDKFDLAQLCAQIAAIVVSGNVCVALMSEKGSAFLAPLAEAFATSDLPKGVVNLLTGHVAELYTHFGSHMEVHSISVQSADKKLIGDIKELGVANLKRVVPKIKEMNSLEHVLSFVEFKTVWHPIGN